MDPRIFPSLEKNTESYLGEGTTDGEAAAEGVKLLFPSSNADDDKGFPADPFANTVKNVRDNRNTTKGQENRFIL